MLQCISYADTLDRDTQAATGAFVRHGTMVRHSRLQHSTKGELATWAVKAPEASCARLQVPGKGFSPPGVSISKATGSWCGMLSAPSLGTDSHTTLVLHVIYTHHSRVRRVQEPTPNFVSCHDSPRIRVHAQRERQEDVRSGVRHERSRKAWSKQEHEAGHAQQGDTGPPGGPDGQHSRPQEEANLQDRDIE
jgi:hypothetical protein